MRIPVVATLCLAFTSGALAQELPDVAGVLTASGSVFTTEITAGDSDDYVVEGAPGMVLTATVKASGRSFLVPRLSVLRPGGVLATDEDGLALTLRPRAATAKLTLDAAGLWRVRIVGDEGTTGAYAVTIRYTGPSLPVLPVASRGFKVAGSIASGDDTDEFTFLGSTGQSFLASFFLPRSSGLDPLVTVVRPDGTIAQTAGQGTRDRALPLGMRLDANGTWRIRVVGEEFDPNPPHDDATTGPYSLSVRLGKATATDVVPDVNGQYRFSIAAAGDARIGWSLTFAGAAPTFNSLLDPDGRPVLGANGGTQVKSFLVPTGLPLGAYTLTYDAPQSPPGNVRFAATLALPRTVAKRRATLSRTEPVLFVNGVSPKAGGVGTLVTVQGLALADDAVGRNAVAPRILLDDRPLADVELLAGGTSVRGRIPAGMPLGRHAVVVTSTGGQAVARADAFEVIAPPSLASIDPPYGSALGGFTVTLRGANFRAGKIGVLLDGLLLPVTPGFVDRQTVVFTAPAHGAGPVNFGVRDVEGTLDAEFTSGNFEYVASPAVMRITPPLVPLLSSDVVTLEGPFYAATDKVFLETATAGVFEEITASQTTFVDAGHHRFAMPVRPKGTYEAYVEDPFGKPGPRRGRSLVVYSFADVTAASGLGAGTDAASVATVDLDGDADLDLVLSRRGGATASATSESRLLLNDGHGVFTDATASRMPPVGADDWRADRVAAADIDGDGFVDLVLATNSLTVPPAGRSHTRLLMNEARGGTGNDAADRVLRDRTLDLMAPPRWMNRIYTSTPNDDYVADDWRGLDLWVGDLDADGSGRPEIVVTHEETRDDIDVGCSGYCASPYSIGYTYAFYWGGSRSFSWDEDARAGKGRYRFDVNVFPRRSGARVPIGAPGGISFPHCNSHYNYICKGAFTPFTGKRLAVGDLDADGKPDVAVLSDQVVQRRAAVNAPLSTTSSLQVGINLFDPSTGAGLTDMTGRLFLHGGDTTGDALAIGRTGFPDGNALGTIAISKASATGPGSVLRLFRYVANVPGDFQEVTVTALFASDADDKLQASDLRFHDIDADGDEDLVLVAPAAFHAGRSAFRILRNETAAQQNGIFYRLVDQLTDSLVSPSNHFEGDAFVLGDVTGDGLLDHVISRRNGVAPATRILSTVK